MRLLFYGPGCLALVSRGCGRVHIVTRNRSGAVEKPISPVEAQNPAMSVMAPAAMRRARTWALRSRGQLPRRGCAGEWWNWFDRTGERRAHATGCFPHPPIDAGARWKKPGTDAVGESGYQWAPMVSVGRGGLAGGGSGPRGAILRWASFQDSAQALFPFSFISFFLFYFPISHFQV